jgi:hypothetical protein
MTMPKIPNPPPEDVLQIDLMKFKSFLVDLPEGAMRGMRTERDGWDDVVQEITSNQIVYGEAAGITGADFQQFTDYNTQYELITAELPRLRKAVEILTESAANIDDRRQRLAGIFAKSAEDRAHATANEALRTAYEKTRTYRSAIAEKAAKTRKKNEEKKAAEAAGEAAKPGDGGAPPLGGPSKDGTPL